MKKRYILIAMLLCAAFVFSACGQKKEASAPAPTETEAPVYATTASGKRIVEKEGPVEASWFDDAVIVGDSITLKLSYYCEEHPEALSQAQFFCAGSLSYNNALWDIDDGNAVHPVYEGETTLTEECAEKTGASKVFIMLGMNDVGVYGADGALQAAKELTDNILAITPDVSIYIESTTPIAEGCEIGDLNNETIREFDKLLKGFCEENGYMYLDLYTLFQDEKGYLKSEYCSDSDGMGIHFTDTACNMWADYLKENV